MFNYLFLCMKHNIRVKIQKLTLSYYRVVIFIKHLEIFKH